jgi:hypothetical protein
LKQRRHAESAKYLEDLQKSAGAHRCECARGQRRDPCADRLERFGKDHAAEHSLSFQAIDDDAVDAIDVYSTDAKIKKFKLRLLDDDRGYFPVYQAVWVARKAFVDQHPQEWGILRKLEGSISETAMQDMNAQADIQKQSFAQVASQFLGKAAPEAERTAQKIWQRTREHLWLVGVALLFSLVVGIPLGIIAVRFHAAGQGILIVSALVQTIPSLALLCFLIPVFVLGLGKSSPSPAAGSIARSDSIIQRDNDEERRRMSSRSIVAVLMGLAGVAAHSQGCDLTDPRQPHLPPLLGTMSGVRLSLPRTEVGLPSIHYSDDEHVWGENPTKHYALPTQDSIIRDFFISINRKTFLPICSKDDLYSYAGPRLYNDEHLPPASDRWLEFVFSPLMYMENDGQVRRLYETQVKLSDRLLGALHDRPDAFGLRQRSADREAGPLAGTQSVEVFDTWYVDDRSWNTLISCARESTNKTPNKLECVHSFVVPELKAMVSARYFVMADVSDWKRIESEVRKLALSYVVQPVTAPASSRRR